MRLWSIHPEYLDSIGLVALWREALLAKKVLQGKTKGYRHHPQLIRFRSQKSPVNAVNFYLRTVWNEANRRGYSFDKRKLGRRGSVKTIPIASGQLTCELDHLRRKLKKRRFDQYRRIAGLKFPKPHPSFSTRSGGVEPWEKLSR